MIVFYVVTHSVGASINGDDFGVVQQTVEHGRCQDIVSEQVSPVIEGEIAGQDDGSSFISGGDEFEETVCVIGTELRITNLINDQQIWF